MTIGQGHCRTHLSPEGNWCGHNPYAPKFYTPPEEHGYRPDVLLQAQSSLEKFYWTPQKYLQSLITTRASYRQKRTEGRERDAAVLGVILHYLELASMRVGVPNKDGSFKSLSMKDIAVRAGWRKPEDDKDPKTKNKGIKRVWRAMNVLKRAGYLTIHRRVEKALSEEQEYSSLPAIRSVKPKLLHELKINMQRLDMRRKKAVSRLKKIYRDYLVGIEKDLVKGTQKASQMLLDFKDNILGKNNKQNKSNNQKRYGSSRGKKALAELEAKLKAEGKIPDTG